VNAPIAKDSISGVREKVLAIQEQLYSTLPLPLFLFRLRRVDLY
jgi:hypothetical protein